MGLYWSYIRVMLGSYWGCIKVILGLYWGYIRVMVGLYWGYLSYMTPYNGELNGKENRCNGSGNTGISGTYFKLLF